MSIRMSFGLPPLRIFGKGGLYRNAVLVVKSQSIELWLGTPREKFPFIVCPIPFFARPLFTYKDEDTPGDTE
jgi:hypothetical protein